MTILVLDTRAGDRVSDLFVLSEGGEQQRRLRLGYVPELCYDAATHELVLAETSLGSRFRHETQYWLKGYDASTWDLKWKQLTAERPMYTGYPGRSSNIDVCASGRFVYSLQSRMLIRSTEDPSASDTFHLTVTRYDRRRGLLESGQSAIDSCTVAFGYLGPGVDQVYFHLSCDYPSTVAFCDFADPEINWVRMDPLTQRDFSPRETCGSWLDPARRRLYCVAGNGTVYEVSHAPSRSTVFACIELGADELIPLRQIHGNGEFLFVGVSGDSNLRSLSLASEICQIAIANPDAVRRFPLPFPVLNFVASGDGRLIAGTSPYQQAVCLLDASNGRVIRILEPVGMTPAEVLFVEEHS